MLGAAGLSAGSAWAASETVLYSFCQQPDCADGKFPRSGLIATNQGGLYRTTSNGGNNNHLGVAFFVSVTGGSGVLHQFQGGSMDGAVPKAPLFMDKSGNFYGTTSEGNIYQWGTVFKRSASGVYSLRHVFAATDGCGPIGGLIADGAGNLYGTTSMCGANLAGTIFKLSPGGTLTTLHTFCNLFTCTDVGSPAAGLIGDANGNLYGTTYQGGDTSACEYRCGVVFKIHADGTNYTILRSFTGSTSDGAYPFAGLSADPSGNLYGTTELGGANAAGTVFKIAPDGSNYAVLYNFCRLASCADGSNPDGGVILDGGGNLYGTALGGGASNKGGVVFSLSPSGTETVLYSFCSTISNGICLDGQEPRGNLAPLGNGNLYGATTEGGTKNAGTV